MARSKTKRVQLGVTSASMATMAESLPQRLAAMGYGGASSDLSPILDLVARELARKQTAFYNICFSEAKAMFKQKLARKWGHAIA